MESGKPSRREVDRRRAAPYDGSRGGGLGSYRTEGGRMIDGVAGVVIWTDNLDRLQDFYRNTLGLEPHSVRPDFVSFKWGDMRLSLGKHSHVHGKTGEPYRIMVNLGVRDIHAAYESLVGRGVEFTRPPEKEHWGGWVGTFTDPDGNMLQLMQQPDE